MHSAATGQIKLRGDSAVGITSAQTDGFFCQCLARRQQSRPIQTITSHGGLSDCNFSVNTLPNGGSFFLGADGILKERFDQRPNIFNSPSGNTRA
jgi:hypothetical protein